MQRPIVLAAAGAALALAAAAGAFAAGGDRRQGMDEDLVTALDATTWCAPEVHTRISVDRTGAIATKDGKDVCLIFSASTGHLVTQVIWWNVDAGIHVHEWALAAQVGPGRLAYIETEHPEAAGFPGIAGEGTIRLGRDGTMELDQIGLLADGSVAAFRTTLEKVDALPEIPLARTYPAP